jgi:hypothetical protein
MEVWKDLSELVSPTSAKGAKARLEILLGLSTFAAAYLYVWVYQDFLGIRVAFVDFSALLRVSIISTVVFPLVHYLYVKPDPLQWANWKFRSVRFYQLQFPSLYIRDRCQRCLETVATCRNFMGPDSRDHTTYWFDGIWRPIIATGFRGNFERTFERGYTCKLVFGVQLAMVFFSALALITMSWKPLYRWVVQKPVFPSFESPHFLFVLVCFGMILLIRSLNTPDPGNPSGCWKAWREVNDGHKLWLRNNDNVLVDVVCHAGGNTKVFRSR